MTDKYIEYIYNVRKMYQPIYRDSYFAKNEPVFKFSYAPLYKSLDSQFPWRNDSEQTELMTKICSDFKFSEDYSELEKSAEAMATAAKEWASSEYNLMMQQQHNGLTDSYIDAAFSQIKNCLETAMKLGNIDALCAMGWYYKERSSYGSSSCDIYKSQEHKNYRCLSIAYYKVAAEYGHLYAIEEATADYILKNQSLADYLRYSKTIHRGY
ncbi:MAG: hypothetical protein LUH23_07575 [Oscillospiraceae bacterium]|nr:hypothetical protein [Oscillospiraceae bacterium]